MSVVERGAVLWAFSGVIRFPVDTKAFYRRQKTSSQVAWKTSCYRPALKDFSGLKKAPLSRP